MSLSCGLFSIKNDYDISRLNSEQSQVTTSLSVMVCSFGPLEKKHVWSGRKWYVMGWYLLNLWAFCSIRVRKVIDSLKQTKDSYSTVANTTSLNFKFFKEIV